jgi:hypothetical protein
LHHLDTWWNTVATHEENSLTENFAQDNTTDRNQSLTNAVHHFGNWTIQHLKTGQTLNQQESPRDDAKRQPMDAPLVNTCLLLIRGALGCLVVPVGYRVARSQDRLGQTLAFSLAYLLTLVVCQIARAHYFMIWFPAVMFTCLWLIRENRPRLAALYAVVPGILITVHYLFLHSAGAIGLLGLGTALWYSDVCLTVLWVYRKETSESNICLHTAADYSSCGSANDEIRREAA